MVAAGFQRVDAGRGSLLPAARNIFEQILQYVRHFSDRVETGHARATLDGVDVALQRGHQLAVLGILAPLLQKPVGMFEQLLAFLEEQFQQLGIQLRVFDRDSSGGRTRCLARGFVLGARDGFRFRPFLELDLDSRRDFFLGNFFLGDFFLGGFFLGGFFLGGFFLGSFFLGSFFLGDFFLGDFFLGDFFLGDFFLGDFFLGDFFLGDFFLGDFFLGDFFLGDFFLGGFFLASFFRRSIRFR